MKTNYLLILTTVIFMLAATQACAGTKSATPAVVETELEDAGQSDDVEMILDTGSAGMQPPANYGEDSVTCVRNLSLYREYYRQRNYSMAIGPWRWVFNNCPVATENIYINGAVLMKHLFNQEGDPVKREAIIDTLMMVYDKRIEYYGKEGSVLGRKVADLYLLRPNAVQQHYDISEKSVQLEGDGSQADVLFINFQATVRLVEAGLMEQVKVVECYDRAMTIIDANVANNTQNAEFYERSRNNIEVLFEPFTSCENLIMVFQPRFENNPNDPELLSKIADMLERSGCTESALFFNATKNLHHLNPTAHSAFLMGRLETNQENYAQAMEYYEQATKLYESHELSEEFTEELFLSYMLMADISFRHLNRLQQSRAYALEASKLKPDNGRPYILIGDLYATSASSCGTDEFTKLTAYWAAVDKFMQARNIDEDPAVRELATERINAYSQYFPNIEQIFFYGFDRGQAYRVECWINETTRIRARGD